MELEEVPRKASGSLILVSGKGVTELIVQTQSQVTFEDLPLGWILR